ncbi:MAG: alpha/beta hydrolase [Ruminococcaceae bacterium]|nr:alpha/beta hydrolase [Oscillospiraceae bacterium]
MVNYIRIGNLTHRLCKGRYSMNKIVQKALSALSRYDADLLHNYDKTRQFEKSTRPYYNRFSCNMMERILHLPADYGMPERDILVRAFSRDGKIAPLMLFFHGGGFVTGDFDSYSHICANLAIQTGYKVLAVDYRLAPENPFPAGPEDCYAAVQQIMAHCEDWYQTDPAQTVLCGDSAGGTLCFVSCLMARDRGGVMPCKQMLIYPAAWCDYREDVPFPSVYENGMDYLLTVKKLQDYMALYVSAEEDYTNPYFSPLRSTDYSGLPETLIVTMEFDPLRDEGEELGRRLYQAGVPLKYCFVPNGIHGMFSLPPNTPITRRIYRHIKQFLGVTNVER